MSEKDIEVLVLEKAQKWTKQPFDEETRNKFQTFSNQIEKNLLMLFTAS